MCLDLRISNQIFSEKAFPSSEKTSKIYSKSFPHLINIEFGKPPNDFRLNARIKMIIFTLTDWISYFNITPISYQDIHYMLHHDIFTISVLSVMLPPYIISAPPSIINSICHHLYITNGLRRRLAVFITSWCVFFTITLTLMCSVGHSWTRL